MVQSATFFLLDRWVQILITIGNSKEIAPTLTNPQYGNFYFLILQMDWRIRPLVLNIKFWAQQAEINDAKNYTLSSYTLTLMILHYLQCGPQPPVITSLHKRQGYIYSRLTRDCVTKFHTTQKNSINENSTLFALSLRNLINIISR